VSGRLRIGVLGAARIVEKALVVPARAVPEVEVTAIAARDPQRAREQARRLGIPKAHNSYMALLADRDIDAVYVPLPNSLHSTWSLRAMAAGKHVLCEKPIASNESEARTLADVAAKTDRVIAEAMHPHYHALFDRVRELLADGAVGEVRHVEAHTSFPIPSTKDIRWQYELGGGALMDLGVYAVALLRELAAMEPAEVTAVTTRTRTPDVDRWVDASVRFPGGASGRVLTSMWGWPVLASRGKVIGSAGELTVHNPIGPQLYNKIVLTRAGRRHTERVAKRPDTYTAQLRAFAGAVLRGEPLRTGPAHFVPTMRVIDAIYHRAGLPLRGSQPTPIRPSRKLSG
jgi:predicted dehydrogenase